ncbi:beta-1,3-galactosyltransferase 5-like [Paramacrobiotus metropolitanus]|uniref:beta-1,3-galactosyltransferase 5-like n=1 Tax=Paramacrobiotus metropolitanus TaxID=2943436 RepID=UPI002445FDB1|nr:beta-1,3-galactosyltransferase 5-like [Paramacrobiotus metropolitanus]
MFGIMFPEFMVRRNLINRKQHHSAQNVSSKLWIRVAILIGTAVLTLCFTSLISNRQMHTSFYEIEILPRLLSKRRVPLQEPIRLKLDTNFSGHADVIARQYTISPKPCKDVPMKPFLVLVAFSRIDAFALRTAIRKTWGSVADPNCGVRLLFMFGRVYKKNLQLKLEAEALEFGDIIQSNQFDDVYRSAAQKAIYLLQWGAAYCPESVYTAKIDDDNWLNLPLYYKFLQENQKNDYVYGAMFNEGSPVIRNTGTKYYVPREEFDGDVYPEYLSGILYAFPTRFLDRVLQASLEVQRTFNDDVYVCGLLTTKANLTRMPVPRYAWDQPGAQRDSNCTKRDMMCIHYSKDTDYYRMWDDPCYTYPRLC